MTWRSGDVSWTTLCNTWIVNLQNLFIGSFGYTYPKTYWSALKQSIHGLNSEEKHLFFLICTCKGPSVLQDILQFFCTITVQKCDRMSFPSWKDKLKSSHLVFEKDKKMLSIHSLTKRLVDEYMLEDQESAVHALVEKGLFVLPSDSECRDENTSVIIALVSLYIETHFGETLALKVGLTPVLLRDARIRTIEPIAKVLVLEVISHRSWAGELYMSAKQVLLQFVYSDTFDHKHILQLSGWPAGIMAILQFLKNATLLESAFWEKNSTRNSSQCLFRAFTDATDLDRQVQAATVVEGLCYCDKGLRVDMVNRADMVSSLVQAVEQDGHADLAEAAASGIANLASTRDSTMVENLLNVPGLLSSLVKSIQQDGNSDLAAQAGSAICNLAATKTSTLKGEICFFPNLVECLAASLSQEKSKNGLLQWHAACAIFALADNHEENMERFFNVPGLLSSLVKAVQQDGNADLAKAAMTAIANLACTENSTMEENLLNVPGLLSSLVKSVQQDENSDLAAQAGGAIRNFVATKHSTLKGEIGSFPNLVESLAASLSQEKSQNNLLQCHAAWSVSNLANHEENEERLFNVPGLLSNLVRAVEQDGHADLAEGAASGIASLAATNHSTMEKNLLNVPGLLSSLVKSIQQDENSDVAAQAGRAIRNLATTQNSTVKGEICSFPNLVECLAALLSQEKSQNGLLQCHAAWSIFNLAKHEENKERLFNVPGLLSSLVRAVEQDGNSNLAEGARRAMSNLAAMDNSTMRSEMVFPDLVHSVQTSSSK